MKKFVYILLLIISMGTMHYFSSQDGSTSKAQSNAVIEIIDDIRDKVTIKNERIKKAYIFIGNFIIYTCLFICRI